MSIPLGSAGFTGSLAGAASTAIATGARMKDNLLGFPNFGYDQLTGDKTSLGRRWTFRQFMSVGVVLLSLLFVSDRGAKYYMKFWPSIANRNSWEMNEYYRDMEAWRTSQGQGKEGSDASTGEGDASTGDASSNSASSDSASSASRRALQIDQRLNRVGMDRENFLWGEGEKPGHVFCMPHPWS